MPKRAGQEKNRCDRPRPTPCARVHHRLRVRRVVRGIGPGRDHWRGALMERSMAPPAGLPCSRPSAERLKHGNRSTGTTENNINSGVRYILPAAVLANSHGQLDTPHGRTRQSQCRGVWLCHHFASSSDAFHCRLLRGCHHFHSSTSPSQLRGGRNPALADVGAAGSGPRDSSVLIGLGALV